MAQYSYTKKALAEIAGYSYRQVYDIDKSLPANAKLFVKSEEGKYDLSLFVQRWVKYQTENISEAELTLEEARTIHEKVKTRRTELEVQRLEGQLVDVEEIRRLWGGVAHNVMNNMRKVPDKICQQLRMVDDVKLIASIIDTAITDALNNIADTPLPETEMPKETDEQED